MSADTLWKAWTGNARNWVERLSRIVIAMLLARCTARHHVTDLVVIPGPINSWLSSQNGHHESRPWLPGGGIAAPPIVHRWVGVHQPLPSCDEPTKKVLQLPDTEPCGQAIHDEAPPWPTEEWVGCCGCCKFGTSRIQRNDSIKCCINLFFTALSHVILKKTWRRGTPERVNNK